MMRRAFWIPLFALLALAAVLGVALSHGGNPSANASPLTGEAAPALDIPMLDVGGKHVTSASLVGKPHLLNFFASWCGPCAMENPILMHLAKKHEVDIIGVALKDSAQPLVQYLANRGNPYDLIGMDDNGRTAIDWGVSGVPETFAIDAQGKIVGRYVGGLTEDDADHMVKTLLQEQK